MAERSFYKPMLLQTATTFPMGKEWLFEPKLDGFRVVAYVDPGEVHLFTRPRDRSRRGNDCTGRFRQVADALPTTVRCQSCVLDGEMVAVDSDGHPQISLLRRNQGRLMYYAFDILERNGQCLTKLPLVKRKDILHSVVRQNDLIGLCGVWKNGVKLLATIMDMQLEGIVAKKKTSLYMPGRRSSNWLKIRIGYQQD